MAGVKSGTEGRSEIRGTYLVLLSLAGMVLSFASSAGRQIEWLQPDVLFGLYGALPILYWTGIGVTAVSLFLGFRSKNEWVFSVQFLILYVTLWSAPALFERYPSVWDSYMHFFSVQSVAQTGSSLAQGALSYTANYPGFFVVNGVFVLLGNPPVLGFLSFYPVVVSAITFVALYLFVRTYVSGMDFRLAILICALANVWVQFSFSPQSLGLVAGLLVFVFLEKGGLRWSLMALAAFGFVVVSHPTTMLLVLGGLVVREILVRYRNWRPKVAGQRQAKWPLPLFILVAVVWLFTGARSYSGFLGSLVIEKIMNIFYLPSAISQAAALRTAGNIFLYSPFMRTALLGVFFLLLALTLFVVIRKGRRDRPRIRGAVIGILIFALIAAPMDIFFLQGQIYDRAILFFALCAPLVFVPILLWKRGKTMRAVVAVAMVVSIACAGTAFYQESLYVVSGRSVATSDYLLQAMPINSSVIGGTYPDPVWTQGDWGKFVQIQYWEVYPNPFANLTRGSVHTAMVFDRTTQLWQMQWGTTYLYDFYLNQVSNSTKVMDNGAYSIIYGGTSQP